VLRPALLASALVACVLLVIAEFSQLNEIQILTVTEKGVGVGENHNYALAIIAVAAAVMAFGAFRGARPAAFALAALGVAALLVVLIVDVPEVGREGLFGRDYEGAKAVKATGFYLETAGAVLLLATGVLTAALNLRREPA
jgi:hypothetical protein